MDELTVFITLNSISDVTIFEWERHIEEVKAALIMAVPGNRWGQVHVYGPNTSDFSPPAMCIRATMNAAQVATFLNTLAQAAPWLSLPVDVHVTTAIAGTTAAA